MKTNQLQKNIPIGWQEVKLSDVSVVNMGQSPLSSAYNNKKAGLPLIQGNNDIKNKKTVGSIWTSQITKVAEKGQLILTVRAPVGAVGIAHDKVCIGRGVCAIESKYKPFIWYFLNYFEPKWNTLEQGSTFTAVNSSDIRKIKLMLPSISEQNRIVSVLETWDKTIEKLTQKIEAKKQVKKALMQDLLTGKKRLDGFREKWETVELKEVCEINPKVKSLPDSFVYIDLGSVENGILLKENIINSEGAPSRAQRLLEIGDIIFQVVRPYQKNNFFFNKQGDYVASTGYAQIRAKKSAPYLYWLLHTDNFVNKVIERCTGSNYPAINSTDLSEIEVDIPKSNEEQKAIAHILTTADKEITELKKKLFILKEQKRYLLNNLITGTIRTPETLSIKLTK